MASYLVISVTEVSADSVRGAIEAYREFDAEYGTQLFVQNSNSITIAAAETALEGAEQDTEVN